MFVGEAGSASEALDAVSARERVLRCVTERPGSWGMEIARLTDLAFSTVFSRLADLEAEGHVQALQVDRERHFFPAFTPWEMEVLALLRAPEGLRILQHAARRPGLDNREAFTAQVGVSNTAVGKYTDRFVQLGLLRRVEIPSTRRPGVGWAVAAEAAPRVRFLLLKLTGDTPEVRALRDLLASLRA